MQLINLKLINTMALAGLLYTGQAKAMPVFPDITLGEAGGSPDFQPHYNLGIFVTGPTTFSASNSGTLFDVNLGLTSGATTNFSGGGTLTGNLYLGMNSSLQNNFSSQFNVEGGIISADLSQALTDVQTAAAEADELPVNQTYGNIGSSPLTISSTSSGSGTYKNAFGGYDTVVDANSINITNPGNDLIINGSANDYFIFNISGNITVSNGEITTIGGIPDSNILFNVLGTGNSVNLSNHTSLLTGTYLAPNEGQEITISPGTVEGALIGYQIQTSSGPTITGQDYGSDVAPEPATALLMMLGGLGILGKPKFGRRRPQPG